MATGCRPPGIDLYLLSCRTAFLADTAADFADNDLLGPCGRMNPEASVWRAVPCAEVLPSNAIEVDPPGG